MEPYDIGATIDRHYEDQQKLYKLFAEKSRECFELERKLEAEIIKSKQWKKWLEYYKSELERVKKDYGFYLVTKSVS